MKESEEQWRLLAENINEGIILADCLGKVFFWNKGAENIFRYRASEVMGNPLPFIMPEGQRPAFQEKIDLAISGGKIAPEGKWQEVVGLRKDWSKFPLEMCLTTWNLRGKALFICLARDITERKRMEDGIKGSLREKERLLEDIQRQVENNLRAIYSLIDLQFEYLRDNKAITMLKESRERIRSISLMHEKLNQDKVLARVDLATYFRNLAHRLFEAFSPDRDLIGLKLDIEEVFLDIRTAIPCGLIASELISNSLKYAFPAGRAGEVAVEFHRKTGPIGQYSLAILDNGVGFPKDLDFRKAKSLGLQIVTDLVSQLPGQIRLDRRGGTKFTITFPA
jgi:PAS domain S-box-containing protein